MNSLTKTFTIIAILLLIFEFTLGIRTQGVEILRIDNKNKTIIVDINGKGDFISIQEAINSAPPGSTIYIKNGKYSEIIDIKKQINIIGEDNEKTIINPISNENKCAIKVRSKEITIKNLSITNQGPGIYTAGIHVLASKTNIQNCNFYNNPIGIVIWTSNNIVSNSNFWGCSDEGIALIGTSNLQCSNNKITNCEFYDNCDGIELQYSSNNTITGCLFYNNTHTGIDAITSSNNRNIISNCNINNNKVHGIYLSSSSENQIINCDISNNKDGNIIQRKNCYNNVIKTNTNFENRIKLYIKEKLMNLINFFENKFLNRDLFNDFSYFINLHFV